MRTLFMVLITCLFVLPAYAKYSGGTGEPNDPYQIATATDLIALGETPEDYDEHFILTADLDLDPNLPGRKVFDKAVIAPDTNDVKRGFQGTAFSGVFDGNGYTIFNLTYESNSVDFIGLFGYIDDPNAEIVNLRLINPSIYAERGGFVGSLVGWFVEGTLSSCYAENHIVVGSFCVGGLVGENLRGTIHSCRASGDVIGKYTLGGLVGRNREGAIINCHVNINVSGERSSSFVGGLVGDNAMSTDIAFIPGTRGGWIFNCCATGSVSGGDSSDSIGGMVGYFGDGSITNSYSTAHVTGGKKSTGLGGLVGDIGTILGDDGGWVANCFAAGVVTYGEGSSYIGGLVGSIWLGGISNSFWDVETTGQTTSDGGTGKTTAQMKDINTYLTAGWDFIGETSNGISDTWRMSENGGYPVLNIFQGYTPVLPDGRGTAEEPFLVNRVEELGLVWYYPLAFYRLDANIDLSEIVWSTAVIPWFGGYFDGNGHMLSNLSVQGGGHLGLFGTLDRDAVVTDLGIENVSIQGTGDFIGGLVGDNYGSVSNCYIIGSVSGNDALSIGGLVGDNSGDVTHCYSSGAVNGGRQVGGLIGLGSATHCYSTATVGGNRYVGGLVGFAGNVEYCYSAGEVSGDKYVGGLVGYNFWNQLTQCYSTGAADGNDSVGGLVGYSQNGSIVHCYSTGVVSGRSNVGGLMGRNERGTVLDCFWDIETSNQNTSAGGIGKTTAAMQDIRTYLDGGWDFVDEIENGAHQIWQMPEGGGYPILSIFSGYTPLQLNGLGTAEDPYLISNALELGAMIYYSPYAHYRLDSSIDLLGIRWSTAVIPAFEGTFDGNNLTISHLTIKGVSNLGLFEGLASGAEIKDLELVDVNITGLGGDVGGLAVYNYGTITHCYITGTGAVSGKEDVGGLLRYNAGTMTHCYSTGSVHGEGWAAVGGLMCTNDGTVTQCYSTGAVRSGSSAGGLMSHNYGTVTQCYSTGAVSGREWVGGLVGFNSGGISNCYSMGTVFCGSDVGGLVGYNTYNGRVTNCFWDTQTSGQTKSAGGTGKTTSEMQTASTFLEAGWDFVGETANGTQDIWWILEGKDYPRLWWELSN